MASRLFSYISLWLAAFVVACQALPVAQGPPIPALPENLSRRDTQDVKSPLAARSLNGPVITSNFPDPGLIQVNNVWYAFATRTVGSSVHIQVAQSSDFDNWSVLANQDGNEHDALPTLPTWVNNTGPGTSNTWAPSVVQLVSDVIVYPCKLGTSDNSAQGDGSFVLYFAATTTADSSGAFHCIGAATASNVIGPYTAREDSLLCPLSNGGAIDPAGFQDADGNRYIVYKVDGNSLGHGGACGNAVEPIVGTPLILQPVASDGITLTGSATTLLDNAGASDGGVIEAPELIRTSDGTYVLFFSSGCFTTPSYTVSYATASSVTGPYTRNPTPLFQTGSRGLTTPGSASVWSDAQHMVLHANNNNGGRSMYTAIINVEENTVTA